MTLILVYHWVHSNPLYEIAVRRTPFILGSQRVVNKINRPIRITIKPISGTALIWYQSHETRVLSLVRIRRVKHTRVESLIVMSYYSPVGININA